MSYVLCLGFLVNVYKKFPKIRIFLNDTFIDEFFINGVKSSTDVTIFSESLLAFKNKSRLKPIRDYFFYKETEHYVNSKVYLKFFELDENYINSLEKHKLKIQVFNDDNNFTNGFLTKSTLISIPVAYVIPKKILTDYLNFMKNHSSFVKESRCKHISIKEILNEYSNKNIFFDSISFTTYRYTNYQRWYDNKNIIHEYPYYGYVGISGYTELFFDKTVYSYNKSNVEKFWLNNTFLYLLGNKYVQYANQRNID